MLKRLDVVVVIVKYCPLPGTSIVLMMVFKIGSPLILAVSFRARFPLS